MNLELVHLGETRTAILCNVILIYFIVSRHEDHSMNTHTLQNAGW